MRSPPRKLDVLEVRYLDDPWRLLVCCILLNRTRRDQVVWVIDDLFGHYPDAGAMARGSVAKIARLIGSLGFQNQRAKKLKELSRQVRDRGVTEENVASLCGVGRYAVDAYLIFVEGRRGFRPDDYALRNFLRYEGEPFNKCPECMEKLRWPTGCLGCGWEEHPFYLHSRISKTQGSGKKRYPA